MPISIHQMKYLVDERYPQAEKIGVIQDQLNTHVKASLYKAFPPEEAKRILEDGAKLNGKTLDPRLLEIPDQRTTSKGEIIPPSGADNETILDVLKTPCLIKRLLILFLAWY